MYAFELARAWALSFSQFSFLRSLTASAIPASADRETLIPRDFASLRRALSSDRFVGLRTDFATSVVPMACPLEQYLNQYMRMVLRHQQGTGNAWSLSMTGSG